MTLRGKLLAFLVGLPVGSITVLGLLVYTKGRAALETSLGRVFEVGAVRSLESLDRELAGLNREAEAWARLDRLQDVLTEDLDGRISSFLVARARERPQLWRAVVADAAGRVIAASDREWLGSALKSLAPASGPEAIDACRDVVERPATVACSFAIRARFDERQVLGTLEVFWDLGRLGAHIEADGRRHAAEPVLVLMRRDATVVWAPAARKDWIGTSLAAAGSQSAALARDGRQGYLVEPIGGEPSLVGYAHSAGATGWSVLVLERTAVAFAPIARLRFTVLAVAGSVALVSVLASLLLTGRLTRTIRELEAGARRVAEGDLSVRLAPRSDDEIGSLTRSFDRMVRELSQQRAQLVDKEYVDSLIAGMNDGLFVVDESGCVERANPALLRLAGAGDLTGQPAGALFVEGEAVFRESVVEAALAHGAVSGIELGLRARGTGVSPVIVSAGRLPATARGTAIVCTLVDIAQRKQTEAELLRARSAAEQAAAAKAQFLAIVSHEVRTPLNGIIGTTELLAGTRLNDKQREYVQTAQRSSEALLSLLSDILDYSRMDAGRLELTRAVFDLRECVFEAADPLSRAAQQKGLELAVQVDEQLSRRVVGDPGRLRQVLLNLGGNAVKFTDAGSILVRVTATPGRPSRVAFQVSDTGIGIPEDRRALVFDPFQQVDASTTRRHGGVGLGLAIVRQLVELMGGTISMAARDGGGTVFSFDAELPPVADERPRQTPNPEPLAGRRVLVVDDDPTNRLVLREMLATWRCTVEEAADAWEALSALRSEAEGAPGFDLALVDFQMPEMDGAALARDIKCDARLARLPLVLLTSIPQHAEAGNAQRDGFAACLTKPIRQAQLLEALLDVLRARAAPPTPHLVFRPIDDVAREPDRG